jgi:hypothetical protein
MSLFHVSAATEQNTLSYLLTSYTCPAGELLRSNLNTGNVCLSFAYTDNRILSTSSTMLIFEEFLPAAILWTWGRYDTTELQIHAPALQVASARYVSLNQ